MREERRQDPKPTHVNVSYINETKPTELVKVNITVATLLFVLILKS